MFIPTLESRPYPYALGKIICVGRNYVAHAKELNNPVPKEPVLFMKPATSACDLTKPLILPNDQGAVHHELEIAVLIGKALTEANKEEAEPAIAGVGLGLDLTLREVQSRLKENGLPWERAKAFDSACPLSEFIELDESLNLEALSFSLTRNGLLQQQGDSSQMLFSILDLISHVSHYFTLNPGDILMTGTPAGVGELQSGDLLELTLENRLTITTRVES